MRRHCLEVFFASKNVTPTILQKICNSFEQRFGRLEDDELFNKTATQRDTILNHIGQLMNTKSWIAAPRSCVSKETFLDHIDSLKYIFNQFNPFMTEAVIIWKPVH